MGKNGKITELSYSIEALEDEIDRLNELADTNHSRILDLITENDRLTLAYEPYRPEDDEDYGLTFYGLKEENEDLRDLVATLQDSKKQTKKSLRQRLHRDPRFAGDVAFDYWPPSDWARFSLKRFRPGQYWQLCIGPIRVEFFAN